MQTKQQKRAKLAIDAIANLPDGIDEKTANFIVGTPTMILTNGLGQTLAFLLSKKSDKEKKLVFDILKKWLCEQKSSSFGKPETQDIEFLKKFNDISQSYYLWAQHEALSLLEWLKRYAKAFEKEKQE